ncbi:MAG: BatA and WFA domain-containing protein [Candidatus Omnitrophota bacterium]|nr:BatA and WFA domain-containing protein [Candidatus Omnitrophota bacterium]
MHFLSPLALLWLGAIPVLLWLWRLAATHRQIQIPSLVPFEHLLRRPPHRRTRLFVNTLFWLQLAALALLALALARPVVFAPQPKTILAVVDTSASMGARLRGATALERAKRMLRTRVARKAARDAVFIVSSAPVAAVTPEATNEASRIRQAIEALRVSDMAGNLPTAVQIGRALLGGRVDEVLIVTDEPRPAALPDGIEFLTVGESLPNVAIVGVEAQQALCAAAPASLVATVENFSDAPSRVQLTAKQQGRPVAPAVSVDLKPHERTSLPMALSDGASGWVEVVLEAPQDALAVDNRVRILVRPSSTLPVTVVSEHDAFRQVIGQWLSACEGLVWTSDVPPVPSSSHLVVTDREGLTDPQAVGVLHMLNPAASQGVALAHWVVAGDHAIGSYLPPVESVVASMPRVVETAAAGEPVLWGLAQGRRVPVVLAGESEGRRMVSFFIDPVASPTSIPIVVTFFNSLRWLMGQTQMVRTGEPVLLASVEPGSVTIDRPDGMVDKVSHPGGALRYDDTTRAGFYRVHHGKTEDVRAVNFLDPLESNVLERASTWRPLPPPAPASPEAQRAHLPLATLLMALIVGLLLAEWWIYCRKKH